MCCIKKRKQNEKEISSLFATHGFVTFKNEVWCIQMPAAFLYKRFLASFCLQNTSHEFFYRPCNFRFNILSSFEIIAKTLSVALEVSLSIVILFVDGQQPQWTEGYFRKRWKEQDVYTICTSGTSRKHAHIFKRSGYYQLTGNSDFIR